MRVTITACVRCFIRRRAKNVQSYRPMLLERERENEKCERKFRIWEIEGVEIFQFNFWVIKLCVEGGERVSVCWWPLLLACSCFIIKEFWDCSRLDCVCPAPFCHRKLMSIARVLAVFFSFSLFSVCSFSFFQTLCFLLITSRNVAAAAARESWRKMLCWRKLKKERK